MTDDFHIALDYISLCADRWDFELMHMAHLIPRSQVWLHRHSPEGLRLVRGVTPLDQQFEARSRRTVIPA